MVGTIFQPTLPVRGATLDWLINLFTRFKFQPTLPVRGATSCGGSSTKHLYYFNPRSPCGERRYIHTITLHYANFNPRSPCGERRSSVKKTAATGVFQPTLPVRGATPYIMPVNINIVRFQPTLPVRGATVIRLSSLSMGEISTHAPRAGSDRN